MGVRGVVGMKRLHRRSDPNEPVFLFYCEVIRDINQRVHAWHQTDDLTGLEVKQAVGSALLALASNYFRNVWRIPKDQFMQVADEEYDLHGDSDEVSLQ